eukprot:1157360-Pelagomonas_calceolata.AAC.3
MATSQGRCHLVGILNGETHTVRLTPSPSKSQVFTPDQSPSKASGSAPAMASIVLSCCIRACRGLVTWAVT